MGTDIHLITQLRGAHGWRTVRPPAWWPRDTWDQANIASLAARLPDAGAASRLDDAMQDWGIGRSYHTFAVLADVRNGYGFAGIKTASEAWPVIAPPRGLPPDYEVDDPTYPEDHYTGVWLGDHSHSWVTLAEVLTYPWDVTRNEMWGVVTLGEFARMEREGGAPKEWAGAVSGPHILMVTPAQARSGVGTTDPGAEIHVEVTWGRSAREACSWFRDTLVPAWERLAREGGVTPEDVRFVFGFDS